MDANELILFMAESTGKPKSELSRSISDSRFYLNTILSRKTVPMANTYATIADVCGYDLLVRRRSDGYEIPIDPK